MIVINLLGSPCAGKSTTASELFYRLKVMGYRTEIICEYAKELWYEENPIIGRQLHVFAEQLRRQERIRDKVDILITDSPLLLSIVYNNGDNPHLNDLIAWEFNTFNNMVYFLNRGDIAYERDGRFHDAGEAEQIDGKILGLMADLEVPYKRIATRYAANTIINDIEQKLASQPLPSGKVTA
jgi:hypothetical protein